MPQSELMVDHPPYSPPRRWSSLFFLAWLAASFAGLPPAQAAPPAGTDFSRDVLPILSDHCFACHGPDSKTRKADLRLDQKDGLLRAKDPIVVAGKSGESELIARVANTDPDEAMPPPKFGKPLTPAQVATLKRWVDEGAKWGRHWAFEPLRRLEPPASRGDARVRNPIDRFVLARLDAEGLEPSPEADKATLIRRLSLDLTGLPPVPAEVDAFLADPAPDAYTRLVDRLLASPQYGERMAMDWLDQARYADTNGYQNDFSRIMWPWRDWVIDAFNANIPFDRFVTEQIAGDLLPNATLRQKIATGFNRNNRTVTEAGSIDEEWRIENAVDRVETTATVFLGLTMGCARCHDHKYDPVSQADFYRFLGFFNSLDEKGVYTEQRGNVPPLVEVPSPDDLRRVREAGASLAAAEAAARLNAATHAPHLGLLAYVVALRQKKDEAEKAVPTVMVMADAPKPRDLYFLKRGRYDMPETSKKLEPGAPASLAPFPADAPRNRLGLARWLVSGDNPLTARVLVNRLWEQHFGVGLVKTSENLGVQSEPPSHQDLLDWVAGEFVRTGWDVKALHRLIVTSATYRQTSKAEATLVKRDPENRLLARGPRFRMPAEMVRDNALAISGLLVNKVGGPSIKPYQPAGLWDELAGGAGEGAYVQDKGPNLYRRSLYVYRKRTVPYPGMANFDAPSREYCQVKRARTNTPLQALELLNDVTYLEAARRLAERMLTEGGRTADERIVFAFRRATARRPTVAELQVLRRGLDRYRSLYASDHDAAAKLIHQGESTPAAALDPAELAAYTATADVILNLDETITRE
jgi:mono/diheme cytochrome c family protein